MFRKKVTINKESIESMNKQECNKSKYSKTELYNFADNLGINVSKKDDKDVLCDKLILFFDNQRSKKQELEERRAEEENEPVYYDMDNGWINVRSFPKNGNLIDAFVIRNYNVPKVELLFNKYSRYDLDKYRKEREKYRIHFDEYKNHLLPVQIENALKNKK
jgi:hypothetical protein